MQVLSIMPHIFEQQELSSMSRVLSRKSCLACLLSLSGKSLSWVISFEWQKSIMPYVFEWPGFIMPLVFWVASLSYLMPLSSKTLSCLCVARVVWHASCLWNPRVHPVSCLSGSMLYIMPHVFWDVQQLSGMPVFVRQMSSMPCVCHAPCLCVAGVVWHTSCLCEVNVAKHASCLCETSVA